MAGRLPVGASRNSNSTSFGSYSSSLTQDISAEVVVLDGRMTCYELDSEGSDSHAIPNESTAISNHTWNHTGMVQPEATVRSKARTVKTEPTHGDEWIEQDEPGVYITLLSLPGGVKDLKRVRFRYVKSECDLVSLSIRRSMYSTNFSPGYNTLKQYITHRFSSF